jgi:hypothetical protein
MNPLDHQLDRLLRSASAAPSPAIPECDLGLQKRVLAAVRRTPSRASDALSPGWWWRGAFAACSLAVVVVALAVVNAPVESQDPYASPDPGVDLIAPGFAMN